MQALFKLFFEIATLSKGPQDVPYSRFLFISLLIVLYVLEVLLTQILTDSQSHVASPIKVALYLLFVTVVYYSVIYLLLRAHGFANRTVQTFTALGGAELVITAVQIPVLILGLMFEKNMGFLMILNFLYITTIGWDLVVSVHIFRQAFSVSTLRASIITLALFSLVIFMKIRFEPVSG